MILEGDNIMILLKSIAEILDENGLSVIQAATLTDTNYNTVYAWYTGRRTPGMREYGKFITKLYNKGIIKSFVKAEFSEGVYENGITKVI